MTAKSSPHSNLPALITETPLTPQPPVLVLFGRDRGGRPRAAWFDAADAAAARTAATPAGLRVLPITDEAGRTLARQLARGRMLPSGRAHASFAKRDLYARLVALAGEEAGLTVAAAEAPKPSDPQQQPPVADTTVTPPALASGQGEPPGKPPAPRPGAGLFVGQHHPGDRGEIGLGSIVLAHEGPEDGWWEAEVIGVNGPVLALRWVGWPTDPTILRPADKLALLPPASDA